MYMYSDLFNAGLRFSNERDREDNNQSRHTRRRPSSARCSWPSRSQSRTHSVAPSRRTSSYNPLSPTSLELASPFELAPNGELWFTLKTRRTSSRKSRRSSRNSENTPEGQLRSFLSLDLAEGGSIRSQTRVQRRVNASGAAAAALKAHRTFNNNKSLQVVNNPTRRNSSYLPRAKPLPALSSILPAIPNQCTSALLSPAASESRSQPQPQPQVPSHRRNISNLTSLTTSTVISPSVRMVNRVHALAALEGKCRNGQGQGHVGVEASSFWDMDDEGEVDTILGDSSSSIASPATPPAPTSLPLPSFPDTSMPLQPISVNMPPVIGTTDMRKSTTSSDFKFEFENSLDAEVWKQLISVS